MEKNGYWHWWQSDGGNLNYHHPNIVGVKTGKINFLIFSVQTYVHEKLLSCPLDKNIFNDPL